jgi:hypothetical protein
MDLAGTPAPARRRRAWDAHTRAMGWGWEALRENVPG